MMQTMTCASCGATNAVGRVKCFLCLRPMDAADEPSTSPPIAAGRPPQGASTFGLSSLMLVIALVAVCLGVMREAPGLGIALAIAATPALIRTTGIVSRKKSRGRVLSTPEKLGVFLSSFGVIVTVGAAAGAAFFATCWAGFFGGAAVSSIWAKDYEPIGWGMGTGIILGIIAGLFVLYWVVRRLWPYKD